MWLFLKEAKTRLHLQEGSEEESGELLGKVMGQIVLSAVTWCIQDSQELRPSQHGFMKGKSC